MTKPVTWPALRVVRLYFGTQRLLALHAAGRIDVDRLGHGLQRVELELAALRRDHPAADILAELLSGPVRVSGPVLLLLGLALLASLFGGSSVSYTHLTLPTILLV